MLLTVMSVLPITADVLFLLFRFQDFNLAVGRRLLARCLPDVATQALSTCPEYQVASTNQEPASAKDANYYSAVSLNQRAWEYGKPPRGRSRATHFRWLIHKSLTLKTNTVHRILKGTGCIPPAWQWHTRGRQEQRQGTLLQQCASGIPGANRRPGGVREHGQSADGRPGCGRGVEGGLGGGGRCKTASKGVPRV